MVEGVVVVVLVVIVVLVVVFVCCALSGCRVAGIAAWYLVLCTWF